MNLQEKRRLIGENLQAFTAIYNPKIRPLRESLGLPDDWFDMWIALEYEPDTVSAKKQYIRTPYANLPVTEQWYQEYADNGLFIAQGGGEYYVAPKVRSLVKQYIWQLEQTIMEIEVLSPDELYQLEMALAKVIKAALTSTHPEPYAVRLNHNSNPSIGAPSILKVFQYLTDLGAWGDDAHLAAWQHHKIDGIEWETFGYIWEAQKTTAATITEDDAGYRGYGLEDYTNALVALVKRGWIENDPANADSYRVTDTGRSVGEESDTATLQNYFAPFEILSDADREDVWESLTHLRDALRELVPAAEPA